MAKKQKTAKQMERHLKGVANHYRISILLLVAENGVITLEDIDKSMATIIPLNSRFVSAL